jgi:hypothetical protein
MPDLAEVTALVTSQWETDWAVRFARSARRDGQNAILLSVESASCERYGDFWPDCEITISAQFGDGPAMLQTLSTMFDRNMDGKLVEVIVLIHPRPQPMIDAQPVVPTALDIADR